MRKWTGLGFGALLAAGCQATEGPTTFVDDNGGHPYPPVASLIDGGTADRRSDASLAEAGGFVEAGGSIEAGGFGGMPAPAPGPWQPAAADHPLPAGAFPAGQDQATTLYVCRVPYQGGVHSGEVFALGNCNFGFGGKEVASTTYEVLTGKDFTWQPATSPLTTVPSHAVVSGADGNGVALYVCRAPYMGGVHPGKLVSGYCNISMSGLEVMQGTFDVLLTTANGNGPDLPSASARSDAR